MISDILFLLKMWTLSSSELIGLFIYTEWFYPEKSWTEQSDTQDLPKYFLSLSAKGQDELVLQPESHHEEHPASTAL